MGVGGVTLELVGEGYRIKQLFNIKSSDHDLFSLDKIISLISTE